ncbi:MAG: xanthine dehydrogenase family protein subunit M [Alphaproteobacteria bacterium]
MYAFTYDPAASVEEAAEKLRKSPDANVLAGGMSLIPTMKLRLSSPSDLVDLNGLTELSGIVLADCTLTIGAMTRHAEVAASADVQGAIPALAELAGGIGDVQVRNRGTIGGSICFNDPAADYPAGLVGLGATVHTSERSLSSDEFFVSLYETALKSGEIVTSVSFPVPDKAGWSKFANLASRFAIVAVMVSTRGGGVRVAITGAKECVFRIAEMEQALSASFSPGAIAAIHVSADDLNDDHHADAEYRAHLITVLAKRAVAACG